MLDQAGDDLQKAHALIETWFNDTMDRISAWYKQKTQLITVLFAIMVTAVTGADTIQITKSLVKDPSVRNAIVANAQNAIKNMPELSGLETGKAAPGGEKLTENDAAREKAGREALEKSVNELKGLGLKLGWQGEPSDGWFSKVTGLLITAFAASLGAPFWFDLLNRFMSIRAVGKSPAEKEKAEKPGGASN